MSSLAFTTQPTTTAAGAPMTVTVTAQDGSGNTQTCFKDNVTIALGTNPGGATLGGTATVTAVSGVATFTSLSITKAANGYTLTASVGSTSGTSSAFNIIPGPASAFAFTTQPPPTVAAGAAISVVVTARDQFGNPATSFASSVTMAIGNNPGSATLSGTTAVTANGGVANFTNLSINKVGTGYTLTATPTAGAPPATATSNAFNVTPGPTTQLVFTTQPASGSAGSPLSAIVVTAQDARGNTTPAFTQNVTLTIAANPGGGTLTGGGPVAAVAGSATFNGVSINRPGTGYTLTATAGALTITSDPFDIAVGALAQLVFTSQPGNTVAGVAIAPAVVVTAQDAGGNTVTSFTDNVTVAIGTNPGSGTLSGNLTKAAVAGVVTYNSLSIDKAGAAYTLTATAGGVPQVASVAFNIKPAPAAKLSFSAAGAQQPTTTSAGAAITPAVKVTALDQFDNLDTTFTGDVTAAIGTNPKSGTLTGTATIAAAAGVATFSTLKIDSAGVGYTLTATASGLTDGTSSTFDITPGTATQLVFTQQPTNATAGAGIAPAVKVTALDGQGNVATGYTANVAVAIGNNAGGGTLSGTATVAAAAGVATFPGLSINKSGTGYTLAASSGALTGTTSTPFNIVAGAATHLVVTTEPVNTAAGAAIAPAVVVAAQDALGNTDLTYTANVVASIATNPGSGVLSGTLTRAAAAGVATFDDLNINLVGTGYALGFASGALTATTSAPFNIFANTATHLVFSVQPSNAVAGVAIAPAVVVEARDASDNVATGFTGGVTLAVGNSPSGDTLSGTKSLSAVAGVATFGTLNVKKTGDNYTLTATAGGLPVATSGTFDITPAAATHLVFSQQPVTSVAGVAIPVTVQALDAFDNVDTAYTANMDVSIGTNAGGGTLSGTTPIAATNGVAAFASLSINKSGTGYTLHATSGTLTDVNSSAFDIAPAPLSQLVFTAPPTNVVAGAAIQPDVVVQAQDAFANTVTSFTGSVSIAIGTNAGGGTLGGTTAVNAIAGIATFSNLTIDKAGSGYTLVASATGAPDATSVGFDVTAGTATKLAFTVQPAVSTTAGTVISSTVTVAAQDDQGNTDPTFAGDISVALAGGTANAHLSGTTTITPTGGQAVFSNLSVDSAGTGYTLIASATGLTNGTSNAFAITAGTVTKLAFIISPVTTTAGQAIPTVQVNAQDALGNTVPGYTASVGVAITGGTGKTGALLSGTTSHPAVSGVATFSGLSIDSAGTGYRLTATSGSLTSVVSATFDITAGTATQLVITQPPTTAVAGVPIAPTVIVVARDAVGNLDPNFVQSVTMEFVNNAGSPALGTLSGATVTAASGIATFPALSIDKVGTGYTIRATSGALNSATSSPFNITPGAAAQLVFSVQPSQVTVGAAISPAVKVAAQDANGNTATGFSNNVTIGIGSGSGTFTGSTLTLAAVAGVATFSNLKLDTPDTYTLTASAGGAPAGTTSNPFTVIASTASQLFFSVQPRRTPAGQPISDLAGGGGSPLQVEARDISGQLVTSFTGQVTVAITTNTGAPGATLSGTLTRTAAGGVATFDNLTIDLAASGYKLTATDTPDGLTPATSGFFTIDPDALDHLAFSVQPTTTTANGPVTPRVEVTAQDLFDNTVTAFTGNVSLVIHTGTGAVGAVLSGTVPKAAVAGVATFSDLSINLPGTGYELDASATSATGATSTAFDITASTASRLVFTQAPTSTTAGQAISPAVKLTAMDASDNVLTGFTGLVTVSITSGTGTSGATLSGIRTVAAVAGVATFSNLSIDKKGSGYRLSATTPTLSGATSGTFAITAGAATQVVFTTDPVTTSAGQTMASVVVQGQDAFGNTDPTFTGNVTLAISTNPSNGTLSGTATRAAVAGVATFNDLSIDKSGTGYRVTASSGALATDISAAFSIIGGAADHLVFTVAPSNTTAGVTMSPAVKATAFDAFGNVATGFTDNVGLAITGGTGTAGAVLTGGTPVAAVAGVATFSTLSIDKAGSGYTLSATSTVTGATSGTFTITPAAAHHLAFTVQPANTVVNATITPAVQVTVQDQFNNTVTGSSASVAIAIGTDAAGGSTLSGTTPVTAVNGVATFSNLSINKAGNGFTLKATSGILTLATSTAFNITP